MPTRPTRVTHLPQVALQFRAPGFPFDALKHIALSYSVILPDLNT